MRRTTSIGLVCVFALLLTACGGEEDSEDGGGGSAVLNQILGALPDPVVGAAYDQTLTTTLVAGTYQWSLSSGSLPPGLELEASTTSACRVFGTPAVAGQFPITVQVVGSGTATRQFTLDVAPSGNLVITTVALPGGTAGVAYGQNVIAAGGTGVGYSWSVSAGALPTGLTLDNRDVTLNWAAFTQTGVLDQSLGGGKLAEVSGIAASRGEPGVFWVHDDSGAGPNFYAIDAAGSVLQEYTVSAAAQDWEDIAIGPGPAGDYIYIGDFGDNASSRTNCRILRIDEPAVPSSPGAAINVGHDEFWFLYPGGSQNCETMFVDWGTGAPYLIEKVGTTTPRVHKFPMPLDTAWTSGSPVTLTQVSATGTFVATLTGGDASPDGRRIILRDYAGLREYALPAGSGFDAIFNQGGSPVTAPGGQQYEAVCYSGDGTSLFTTTEIAGQATAPIWQSQAAVDNGFTTISGMPATAGVYTFTLQVRDSAGNTASRVLTITVQ